MSQLSKIRLQLAKLVASFSELKTSNGILYWATEEELTAGMEVYLIDENGEYVEAPDGEYVDEEDRTIIVAGGKVESIMVKEAEAPKEEEAPTEVNVEINAEEVEAPVETTEETVTEAIVEERKEVNELYSIVDALMKEMAAMKEEIASLREKIADFGKMSAAFSAEVEIENKDTKKTNSKLENVCNAIRNA